MCYLTHFSCYFYFKIMNLISDKIRELYKKRGLTLGELATQCLMSQTGLSKMLRNDDFKVSTLVKIASVLNVEITYFFQENMDNKTIDIYSRNDYYKSSLDSLSELVLALMYSSREQEVKFKLFLIIHYFKEPLGIEDVVLKGILRKSVLENEPFVDLDITKKYHEILKKISNWRYEKLSDEEFEDYNENRKIYFDIEQLPKELKDEFVNVKTELKSYITEVLKKRVKENRFFNFLWIKGYLKDILDIGYLDIIKRSDYWEQVISASYKP